MARYWFRPKRYGYGATPVTWEGWAVSIAAALAVPGLAVVYLVRSAVTGVPLSLPDVVAWAVFAVLVIAALMWVTKTRTEGEWKWRWGGK